MVWLCSSAGAERTQVLNRASPLLYRSRWYVDFQVYETLPSWFPLYSHKELGEVFKLRCTHVVITPERDHTEMGQIVINCHLSLATLGLPVEAATLIRGCVPWDVPTTCGSLCLDTTPRCQIGIKSLIWRLK